MVLQAPSSFLKFNLDLFREVYSCLSDDEQIRMDEIAEVAGGCLLSWSRCCRRESLEQIGFGARKWEHYFGKVEKGIELPLEICNVLRGPCPFFPGQRVKDTHILFLLPQTVDGKPLTFNSLGELVNEPKQGHPTQYKIFLSEVTSKQRTTDKPCWFLMTREVIPESRNKSFEAQCALISSLDKNYEVPETLAAIAGAFVHYVETGKRLFSDRPFTFTRCQEQVGGDRVLVSWLFELGLNVGTSGSAVDENVGAVALRKFFGT